MTASLLDQAAIGAAVRRMRQAQKLTLEDMESRSKVNGGNLSKIERGGMGWSIDTMMRIASALRVSVAEIFAEAERGVGVVTASVTLPVLKLEDITDANVAQALKKATEFTRTSAGVGPKAFAFRYQGVAMPEFKNEDLIVVDPDVTPSFGKYVLVFLGDEVLFRMLEVESGKSYLYSKNKQFPPVPLTRKHKIVGVAKQAIRDL